MSGVNINVKLKFKIIMRALGNLKIFCNRRNNFSVFNLRKCNVTFNFVACGSLFGPYLDNKDIT